MPRPRHYSLRQPGRGRRYRVPSWLQGPVLRCSKVHTIECAASFLLPFTTPRSMIRDCFEIVFLYCRASVTYWHLSPDSPITTGTFLETPAVFFKNPACRDRLIRACRWAIDRSLRFVGWVWALIRDGP